jgi:uncharacterized protein
VKSGLFCLVLTAAVMASSPTLCVAQSTHSAVDQSLNVAEIIAKARAGDATSQANLSALYTTGMGVEKDLHQAFNWALLSAKQGDLLGMAKVGSMYSNGLGTPQDFTQAVHWYRKAATEGERLSQNGLGIMYARGEGVKKSASAANILFSLASTGGVEEFVTNRDKISLEMSAKDILSAQRKASGWQPGMKLPID